MADNDHDHVTQKLATIAHLQAAMTPPVISAPSRGYRSGNRRTSGSGPSRQAHPCVSSAHSPLSRPSKGGSFLHGCGHHKAPASAYRGSCCGLFMQRAKPRRLLFLK